MTTLAPLLEAFFTERLMRQRRASVHTLAAYRDTFRLLLRFAQTHLTKLASQLSLEQIDVTLISAFLDYLESERHDSVRTRNARLAAIRSFFRYISALEPAHSALIQHVLALPQKRFERKLVTFLSPAESDALLAMPAQHSWLGRRDRALLLMAITTGLRASELTSLRCEDLQLGHGAHVRCLGKGRKERCTPLTPELTRAMRMWLRERKALKGDALFPSLRNQPMSCDALQKLVAKYAAAAATVCPSIATKRITPHVLRHTAAVRLLQAGVDRAVIALWLGHEQIETTQMYLAADLSIKERALARTAPLSTPSLRYRPNDQLLAFLQNL